jgi:hypothetical protein
MFAVNELGAHFSLDTTFPLRRDADVARDALPARRGAHRGGWPTRGRGELLAELANPAGRAFVFVWQVVFVETVSRPEHERFVDMHLADVAEAVGKTPLDAFLDLALAEDLTTQFRVGAPKDRGRDAATAELVRDPICMAAQRRRRAPAVVHGRGLHDAAAQRVDARSADARAGGVEADDGARRRARHQPTAASSARAQPRISSSSTGAGSAAPPRGSCTTSRPAPALRGRREGYVATVVNGEVVFEHGPAHRRPAGAVLRGY